ncbi:hypothetical protein BVX94_00615 [bacterium B17]|nr:hypothetical protein BVX94_00615 [bacterium B17]
MTNKLKYYTRIFSSYTNKDKSSLSFWHEEPKINPKAFDSNSDEFYMTFHDKALYKGPFDDNGVPMLDYRGDIGKQYNPIAIAQYGLGCFNEYRKESDNKYKEKFLKSSDWLADNLEFNNKGLSVWMHHFDWPYFQLLKSPWYSGLAQGQGLALLARAFKETGDVKYKNASDKAFTPLITDVSNGGTRYIDSKTSWWIEEYITDPPTHILNGFIWALWGVRDYKNMVTDNEQVAELWDKSINTLKQNIYKFDCGYWSLYDLAHVSRENPASTFYHSLHLVQLDIMYRLTGEEVFKSTMDKWKKYEASSICRRRAFINKAIFKLTYY